MREALCVFILKRNGPIFMNQNEKIPFEEDIIMEPQIVHFDASGEFPSQERCHILESWNEGVDPALSIARARVEPGITTKWHKLDGVEERYIIVEGEGVVSVGDMEPAEVAVGDVIIISSNTPQRIENKGDNDLIFYCICSPRYNQDLYLELE